MAQPWKARLTTKNIKSLTELAYKHQDMFITRAKLGIMPSCFWITRETLFWFGSNCPHVFTDKHRNHSHFVQNRENDKKRTKQLHLALQRIEDSGHPYPVPGKKRSAPGKKLPLGAWLLILAKLEHFSEQRKICHWENNLPRYISNNVTLRQESLLQWFLNGSRWGAGSIKRGS